MRGLAVGTTMQTLKVNAAYYSTIALAVADIAATGGDLIVPTGTYTIAASTTIPSYVTVVMQDGAKFSVSSGQTLTINGYIQAGRYQIFTGSGSVVIGRTVYPEWFGADGTGAVDSWAAFVAAEAAMVNGGLILGDPTATYLYNPTSSEGLVSNTSFLTVDGQGAEVHSDITNHQRFWQFNGDSGVDGNWSMAVFGSHVKNWRIGTTSANRMGIGSLRWAKRCSFENIVNSGEPGSSFYMAIVEDCTLRNIDLLGSRPDATAIGILIRQSDNCIVENVKIRDTKFIYGVQIKGGRNNLVKGFSVKNNKKWAAGKIVFNIRVRGDAPWGKSSTTGTYPFGTLSWGVADGRRASINTRLVNCSVEDCDGYAYEARESINTVWENCSYENCGAGWYIPQDNYDDYYTLINPRGKTTVLEAGIVSHGIYLAGSSSAHADVTGMAYTLLEVTLQATNTFKVGDSIQVDGVDAGFTVTNIDGWWICKTGTSASQVVFDVEDQPVGTTPQTITVGSIDGSKSLQNMRILGGAIENSYLDGVNSKYTNNLLIDGLHVKNSGQANAGGTTYYGIKVIGSDSYPPLRPRLVDCDVYDDQVSPTQDIGIYMESTSRFPSVVNCNAHDNITADIVVQPPGNYYGNQPAEAVGQTTNATPLVISLLTCADGDLFDVDCTIIADKPAATTDRAVYRIKGSYYCASGTLTAMEAPVVTEVPAAHAWDATLTVATNILSATVTGATSNTINWRVFISCKMLVP